MGDLKDDLRDLLLNIVDQAGENFSGVGLILYSDKSQLPITDLRNNVPVLCGDLQKDLATISLMNSEFHDGFHLINKRWELTNVSQYFSPPIYKTELLNREKGIGGRYAAAQFGSAIDGVLMTGIATNGNGIAIFENGYEVLSGKTL